VKLTVRTRGSEGRGRRERGFTIVEVVVAMGILLLGMSSILGLLTFGTALARTGELRATGAAAVEAVVADLEERLFPLGDDPFGDPGEPPEELERELPSGIVYRVRTTPDPEELERPGGPLEYRIDVELSWQAGGERRTRAFTTLLLREVPFGERLRRRFVETPEAPAQETP